MTDEAWLHLLLGCRKGHPGLDAMHPPAALPDGAIEPFGVADPAAGRHPVHSAGPDGLLHPRAVPVHDLTIKQVCDG